MIALSPLVANLERTPNQESGDFPSKFLPQRASAGLLALVLTLAIVSRSSTLSTSPPMVRFAQGQIHGFLTLRTLDGVVIASGDLMQAAHGERVTSQLVFHFKDGSLQDETTVFSQRGHFQLLSDRLIQRGPTFKHPMDVAIDASTGAVTVRSQDDKGKEKVETATLQIPPDLANGMAAILLTNMAPGQSSATASMIVATPKPMVVKLAIAYEGEDSFLTGGETRKAMRYDIKVDIPGIRGVVAPIVGKQPPDTHVWVLGGSSPVFLKSEGPACEDCPVWRTELTSPTWPEENRQITSNKKQP